MLYLLWQSMISQFLYGRSTRVSEQIVNTRNKFIISRRRTSSCFRKIWECDQIWTSTNFRVLKMVLSSTSKGIIVLVVLSLLVIAMTVAACAVRRRQQKKLEAFKKKKQTRRKARGHSKDQSSSLKVDGSWKSRLVENGNPAEMDEIVIFLEDNCFWLSAKRFWAYDQFIKFSVIL